ncbi:MAG: hypothetical protein JW776_14755 [Candidatus Lokiarchaeota archaeon]|nr:hypothetical protein [Candidatus Lokiarchaeota archaeon]
MQRKINMQRKHISMARKFSGSTIFFFIIFVISTILIFFVWYEIFFLLLLGISTISGAITISKGIKDKAQNPYSGGTKFFLGLFLFSIAMIIFGYVGGIYSYFYYYIFFLIGTIFIFVGVGSLILTIILLIRDRKHPPKIGEVKFPPQPSIILTRPTKPIKLDELKQMLGIASHLRIEDIATGLDTDRGHLLKFISQNTHELPPFRIEDEYIFILRKEPDWVCQECGTRNSGEAQVCEKCGEAKK